MSTHRIRLKRGEHELEIEGERDFVESQLARWAPLFGLEAPPAPEAGTIQVEVRTESSGDQEFRRVPADFRPAVNLSLADFAALKSAKEPLELLIVAAYYMEKYGAREDYSRGELFAELSRLGPVLGSELDASLEAATARGYLERVRGDHYTLTFKGMAYVREGLDPDAL